MKSLSVLFLFVLTSCGLFSSVDFEPALRANKSQAAMYEELRGAMVKVIMASGATDEQKRAFIQDVDDNRVDFYNFNIALENFLTKAGEIDPDRVLAISTEVLEYAESKRGGN